MCHSRLSWRTTVLPWPLQKLLRLSTSSPLWPHPAIYFLPHSPTWRVDSKVLELLSTAFLSFWMLEDKGQLAEAAHVPHGRAATCSSLSGIILWLKRGLVLGSAFPISIVLSFGKYLKCLSSGEPSTKALIHSSQEMGPWPKLSQLRILSIDVTFTHSFILDVLPFCHVPSSQIFSRHQNLRKNCWLPLSTMEP